MSSTAAWSYTRKATHWPRLSRDDWSGVASFGPPVAFACDYKAESRRMTDAKGIEFTSRQLLYTERANIAQGDFLLIGESLVSTPIAAGAWEVRAVTRYSDTFDRVADDYMVAT
jgi:hypothetical protein